MRFYTLSLNYNLFLAAHCFEKLDKDLLNDWQKLKPKINLTFGEWDTEKVFDCNESENCDPSIKADVRKIIIHEEYEDNKLIDVALVKLLFPLEYTNYIKPVCLQNPQEELKPNTILDFTGFGIMFITCFYEPFFIL